MAERGAVLQNHNNELVSCKAPYPFQKYVNVQKIEYISIGTHSTRVLQLQHCFPLEV